VEIVYDNDMCSHPHLAGGMHSLNDKLRPSLHKAMYIELQRAHAHISIEIANGEPY
jgi:hypothetical protein